MSKKTRKKALKKSPKKPVAKASAAKSATATKTAATKKRAKTADKPSPNVSKKTKSAAKSAVKTTVKKAASKASQQDQSKPLKLPSAVAQPAKSKPVKTNASASSHAGSSAAPAGGHTALVEGMKAPAFQLPRDGGETVSLSDFAGRKLVLFFYPRADTPGCTKEAIDFTRLTPGFAESLTAVLGVSADPLKAQEAFRDKHELAVPLASDEQHDMLESYGAWGEKSMYGRTFLGVLRTTVLIGADGRIVRIWRHVKVDGHADEVLAAAQAA